jgi:hypothetical protein
MITDSSDLHCTGINVMGMTGSAARGGGESCRMTGGHMGITGLFLNNFIKVVNFH